MFQTNEVEMNSLQHGNATWMFHLHGETGLHLQFSNYTEIS